MILNDAHDGVVGGRYARKATIHNILQARLWWPTLHVDDREIVTTVIPVRELESHHNEMKCC